MIHKPRFEDGKFVYDCEGKGCTSEDGTHSFTPNEIIASMITLSSELLHAGDPRTSAILFLASYIRFTTTGNDSLSPRDDPELMKVTDRIIDEVVAFTEVMAAARGVFLSARSEREDDEPAINAPGATDILN